MSWAVRLYREATKALERLDAATRNRILQRLGELAANPLDTRSSKPLAQMEGLRSSRVGSWRILYTVTKSEHIVHVLAVRPRG